MVPWLARALGEPTRREVYLAVQRAGGRPLTRMDVAEAVGIARRLAAFHLDKLVEEGLLDVHYARPADRKGGPGAGRPAKWYRTSADQFDVTIPPRRHDIAARIMARAFERLGPEGPHREALAEEARRCGRALAGSGPDLMSQLADLGYQAAVQPDGTVDMPNCPFHPVADIARTTACSMNHALLDALTATEQPRRYDAVLNPGDNRCCVQLRPRR